MKRTSAAILGILLILSITAGAQTKKPATPADFGQWESLARPGAHGGLSPDGRWLAYGINRSDRNNELRILKLADGTVKVAAFGGQPVFSSDSKWVAYSIGMSEADQEKLKKDKKPVHNKLGLLDLGSGGTTIVDDVESFAFSRDGAFLAMDHYAPAPPAGPREGSGGGGAAASDADEEKPGTQVVVRNLASGRDVAFGNVSQFAWQDAELSHLIALAISAEGKAGNGVQLFDAATGVLRVLDSSASIYAGLAWRKNAPDLAVFRTKTDDHRDGPTHLIMAWTGIGGSERQRSYDPTADKGFPAGLRTVPYRPLSWSDDGRTLFFGIAKWEEKPAPAAKSETGPPKTPAEEPSTVEVWHSKDVLVMPYQKNNTAQLRKRNMEAAWHLDAGAFVQLGNDPVNEEVTPVKRGAGRLRRGVVEVRDGPDDRPPGRRPLSPGPEDRRADEGPRRDRRRLRSGRALRANTCSSCRTTTIGPSTRRLASSPISPRASRPRSSIRSPTRRRPASRPSASPVGRRTTPPFSFTMSTTSGRSRRMGRGPGA